MKFFKKIKIKNEFYSFSIFLFLLMGVFFRFRAFMFNLPLWLDECSLAINIMHRNLFGFFTPLEHIQSAPPFFMILTKFVTMIFGINEYTLRLIPFLSSIASVVVFYNYSKKLLNTRLAILSANFIYALSFRLLYFAEEFKQYASDVLIFMCGMLLINKIELEKIGFKKSVLFGFILFILFMSAMPVLFVLSAFVVYNSFNYNKKNIINLFGVMLPFICLGPFYYFYNLLPTKKLMFQYFIDQWTSGFLNYNILNLLPLIRDNLYYLFHAPKFMLFGFILLIWGIVLFYKLRFQNKTASFLLITLLIVFLASFFNIFPIKERVSLYIIVPFIICIIKPLDLIPLKNKMRGIIAFIMTILFFGRYNLSYIKNIAKTDFIRNKKDGREIMKIMKEKFKPGEVVVYNDASDSIYEFYAEYYNLVNDKYIMIRLPKYSKEFYTSLLNQLPKGHTYWFYYANDYSMKRVVKFIKEWAKDKDIVEQYEINGSFLMHLKI